MAKRKQRTFTPEFKAEVVLEALSGESSQAEGCHRRNLSNEQLSNRMLCHAASLISMGRSAVVVIFSGFIENSIPKPTSTCQSLTRCKHYIVIFLCIITVGNYFVITGI